MILHDQPLRRSSSATILFVSQLLRLESFYCFGIIFTLLRGVLQTVYDDGGDDDDDNVVVVDDDDYNDDEDDDDDDDDEDDDDDIKVPFGDLNLKSIPEQFYGHRHITNKLSRNCVIC
jgi:hypothetical protein